MVYEAHLPNEFHKPIITKFKKRKVCSSFRNNIWGTDSADMQSLSKYNKGNKYLLCAIGFLYASVVPLKDKKETSIELIWISMNFTIIPLNIFWK